MGDTSLRDLPQQTTAPVPLLIAHPYWVSTAIAAASGGASTGPAPRAAPAATTVKERPTVIVNVLSTIEAAVHISLSEAIEYRAIPLRLLPPDTSLRGGRVSGARPGAPVRGRGRAVAPDDAHPNARAHRMIAAHSADFIASGRGS